MRSWPRPPPPPQGSMELDEGVVQGRGRPRAADRSSNPQAYQGRLRHAILTSTTPGREYPHISGVVPGGGLGTYGGRC